jgi:hypothetical protein
MDAPTSVEMFNFVCEHLPEDWRIEIELERGAASVDLINCKGSVIRDFDDDHDTIAEMVFIRVNWARNSDGLSPVNWDGSPYIEI